jgi:hypothetical protein
MRKLLIFLNYFLLVSCEPESNNRDILKEFDLFIADIEDENGIHTVISSGGYLKASIKGIAIENSGFLPVAKGYVQHDATPRSLSIDKVTGEQTLVSLGGKFKDLNDVAEVFVTKVTSCSRSIPAICRLNLANSELTPFSSGNYLIDPTGTTI